MKGAGPWICLHNALQKKRGERELDPDCEGTNRVIWDHWQSVELHLRMHFFKQTYKKQAAWSGSSLH